MALEPCANDPDFKNQMRHKAENPESWGAAAWQNRNTNDNPAARVLRRLAGHFGLSDLTAGQCNLIVKRLLDDAKGAESAVNLESASADLTKRGIL